MSQIATAKKSLRFLCLAAGLALSLVFSDQGASAQDQSNRVLFTSVSVFDGTSDALIANGNVLVEGNMIKAVSADPIEADGATVIDGGGRTLMPGLIDAHWHTMYVGMPIAALANGDMVEAAARAVPKAEATLMRGFTTVRDMGGPAEGLKKIIDAGVIPGPRILPSGAPISQTSGHFDYRAHQAVPAADGDPLDYWNRTRLLALADGVPEMLKRVRENLRMGAAQDQAGDGGRRLVGLRSPRCRGIHGGRDQGGCRCRRRLEHLHRRSRDDGSCHPQVHRSGR